MNITYTFGEKNTYWNVLQGWMMTSLSIVVITSEILALREVRVL